MTDFDDLDYDRTIAKRRSYGRYWSSSPNSGTSDCAWSFYFSSGSFLRFYRTRFLGQSVRPLRVFAK